MKLVFSSKSLEYNAQGEPIRLRVVLGNSDGAFYPVFFSSDKNSLSRSDLESLALDVVYQENFPNRAENEKFSSIDQQMAKMVENEESRSREFEEMKKQFDTLKTESELMQQTMETLILQIMAGGSDHEEFIDNTDIGNADETF
ncbi:TPA: DUF1366 domain-containing protein, partial [Streptococcus suis]